MYCLTLLYSGARRTECLNLRKMDVDVVSSEIAIRTLKQRSNKNSYRRVPVPDDITQSLDMVFDLKRGKRDEKLWPVNMRTANRWIDDAMQAAGIEGHTPKSLRHTFGITMVMGGTPLPLIQKMMGHADISMTVLYTTPLGAEAVEQAKAAWERLQGDDSLRHLGSAVLKDAMKRR